MKFIKRVRNIIYIVIISVWILSLILNLNKTSEYILGAISVSLSRTYIIILFVPKLIPVISYIILNTAFIILVALTPYKYTGQFSLKISNTLRDIVDDLATESWFDKFV